MYTHRYHFNGNDDRDKFNDYLNKHEKGLTLLWNGVAKLNGAINAYIVVGRYICYRCGIPYVTGVFDSEGCY